MATAKQMVYNPRLGLLPKRKDTTIITPSTSPHHHHPHTGPSLTVTIPLALSSRLSRLEARPPQPSAGIRRSRTTLRSTPRTTSLPRLNQQRVARPSNSASRSTATRSGSEAKKTSSGCEASLRSGTEDVEGAAPEAEVVDDDLEELSPEEKEERRLNNQKCQKWLQGLPDKFSSMHVVQHVVYNGNKQNNQDGRCMFLV